jgi:hypothetical protein
MEQPQCRRACPSAWPFQERCPTETVQNSSPLAWILNPGSLPAARGLAPYVSVDVCVIVTLLSPTCPSSETRSVRFRKVER